MIESDDRDKRERGRFYNLNLNLPASYCTCITMCPSSTLSFMPRSLVCFRILIDGLCKIRQGTCM